MWNAQGCEVTVGSHLTQKTGICQTFFQQQTIPKKCSCFKSVSMRMNWLWALGYFSVTFSGARVRQLEISLFLECWGSLSYLATQIRNRQFLRIVFAKKGATFPQFWDINILKKKCEQQIYLPHNRWAIQASSNVLSVVMVLQLKTV